MTALTTRNMRLRIVPVSETEPSQDCGACKNINQCWMPNIKDEHIVLSMLVCRLKRGIEVNRSAKLLLKMLSPKLKKFAQRIAREAKVDIQDVLADLESKTIEELMTKYVMCERAYPLHFLFGPHGYVFLYANSYAKAENKFSDRHDLYREPTEIEEEKGHDPAEGEDETTDATRIAREVVDDGLTLTLPEYRALSFCLQNATDQKRPVNGLHVYLSRITGTPRAKITKIYSEAVEKVKKETETRL